MESFVPLGGFFSTPAGDIKSPLSCSYHTASRCHLCNEKCKQEVNALSKSGLISNVSVADHYQSSLPSWLQMTQLNTNGGPEAMKVCFLQFYSSPLYFPCPSIILETSNYGTLYGFTLNM